ncbi:hypothetical protein MRX96_025237 [Rhipicephalus microplus]
MEVAPRAELARRGSANMNQQLRKGTEARPELEAAPRSSVTGTEGMEKDDSGHTYSLRNAAGQANDVALKRAARPD